MPWSVFDMGLQKPYSSQKMTGCFLIEESRFVRESMAHIQETLLEGKIYKKYIMQILHS